MFAEPPAPPESQPVPAPPPAFAELAAPLAFTPLRACAQSVQPVQPTPAPQGHSVPPLEPQIVEVPPLIDLNALAPKQGLL